MVLHSNFYEYTVVSTLCCPTPPTPSSGFYEKTKKQWNIREIIFVTSHSKLLLTTSGERLSWVELVSKNYKIIILLECK